MAEEILSNKPLITSFVSIVCSIQHFVEEKKTNVKMTNSESPVIINDDLPTNIDASDAQSLKQDSVQPWLTVVVRDRQGVGSVHDDDSLGQDMDRIIDESRDELAALFPDDQTRQRLGDVDLLRDLVRSAIKAQTNDDEAAGGRAAPQVQ